MLSSTELQMRRVRRLSQRLTPVVARAQEHRGVQPEGRLLRMVGLTLEAAGCPAAVGEHCSISAAHGTSVQAQVVGFSGDRLLLMPYGKTAGLSPQSRVTPALGPDVVRVGQGLLGRVLDGLGRPLDGRGPLQTQGSTVLHRDPINPLQRGPIRQSVDVGVRSINALASVGRGQRLGLFAPSGAGKSVLLGMMTRFSNADVIVVALIGERGREVQEFVSSTLGERGMAKAVVVACPADNTPLERVRGALAATAIAEYFRDRGQSVLLLMDSLTRFAQAEREISLAVGEPPATRGFPPSVFARIPELVERAGSDARTGGAITGFYTVLTEDDDNNDPVAECARAILDGHIVLSRALAERGHYPAIDPQASVSRTMKDTVTPEHYAAAMRFRRHYATYRQNQDLISVGAYSPGTDPNLDAALAIWPKLQNLLVQNMDEAFDFPQCTRELVSLFAKDAAESMPAPAKGKV